MKTNWRDGAFRFGLAILILLWSEAWLGAAEPPKSQVKLAGETLEMETGNLTPYEISVHPVGNDGSS